MSLSSSSLRYRVVEGPVELASLRVLESRDFSWAGMRVTVSILGASHAVSIEVDGTTVTELLTCAGPDADGRLLAESGIRADVCVAAHGILCRASIRPYFISREVGLNGAFRSDEILESVFPGRGGLAHPVTCVGWSVQAESMVVETLHTYPEEGIAVRSETHFEIERGA